MNTISRRWAITILFLFGLCFSLYGNTIRADFVYDDVQMVNRPDLRHFSSLTSTIWQVPDAARYGVSSQGYRPLAMASYAINFIFFGPSPMSFHVTNIIIHGIVAVLVCLVVQTLFQQFSLSVITAVLFVMLPIHSENVAAIKYREDMLAALCMLMSWYFLLRIRDRKKNHRLLLFASGLSYLASLLVKELLIFSFLLFWWVEWQWYPAKKKGLKRIVMVHSVALLLYVLIRGNALGSAAFTVQVFDPIFNPLAGSDMMAHIATAGKIAVTYIMLSLVPYQLSATYTAYHFPVVPHLFASWQSVAGYVLLGLLGYSMYRHPKTPLGVGAALFLVSFIPLSKLLFPASDIFAERWMYFPSIGIVLPLAWGLSQPFTSRPARPYRLISIGVLWLILHWYTSIIIPRNRVWANEAVFYRALVHDAPNSYWAHYSMARYLMREKAYEQAEREIMKADAIMPRIFETVEMKGALAGSQGRYEEALEHSRTAMQIDPRRPGAHTNYAIALIKLQRYEESASFLMPLVRQFPQDPATRSLLAITFFKMGKMQDAASVVGGDPRIAEELVRRFDQ